MKAIGKTIWILVSLAGVVCWSCTTNTEKPPNIVLIVADDLGYGDVSCYGGDIITPNLDALAEQGVRFSHFHTSPMCAPTRAMLLSGNDNHIAGVGRQGMARDIFGYEGMLSNRIVPVPQLLKEAGYHTYMAGKWHLGNTPEANPVNKGFERSFVLLPGAGNHYSNQSALGPGKSPYTEDGDSVSWPDGIYSTDFYTDKLIDYIGENLDDEKPFFAFAAYTAPHWPLQVDRSLWEKYEGQYDEGYEVLRENRLQGLKEAGILPDHLVSPPLHDSVKAWNSLSAEDQKKEARKMEVYAGMVDNLDWNIGRLIHYLKRIDEFENTLFVFMSDNGAAYRDFINSPGWSPVLREYYNDEYENMGNENSYISYGPQWAEAGSSPYRYFKDYGTQGGINTTLIMAGPSVKRKSEILPTFTTLLDLAPTFYELAEVDYPDSVAGNAIYPLLGNSLVPLLAGKSERVHDDEYVFALEHAGNAMLRKGPWKITHIPDTTGKFNFSLYNLEEDMGEQNDLRETESEKYAELIDEWKEYADLIQLQLD